MANKICIFPENTTHYVDCVITYQSGSKFTTYVFCVHHSTDLYSTQLFELLIFYAIRYFAIWTVKFNQKLYDFWLWSDFDTL